MLQEQEFLCWHEGQTEEDAKEIKSTSIRGAAKKAVDVWRHELTEDLDYSHLKVFVEDQNRKIHEVIIH